MNKLLQAINFANNRHQGQKRKDGITPITNHLLSVGLMVSQYTREQNIVIAGILHDILEDTATTELEIKELFGEEVLSLVKDCTEISKEKSWKLRKENVLSRIPTLNKDAILIKISDTLHNLSELTTNVKQYGKEYLNKFNASKKDKLEYETKRLELLKTYHSEYKPLLDEIQEYLDYLNSIED